MDSVVGDDLTLPVDINGSCRLPDSIDAGEYSTDSMTAPFFPEKMSPVKALTMKDYENQITALKKENFNLKLRIYFMEERMQQKCDDSTEDIFKTNIELKVELESMKRELAEKQELLVSASKALESLAGRESGDPHRVREHAQREMEALRDAFNKRIADLEQCLRTAEEEVEKMAAIAEQEKLKNIDMGKQLQVLDPSSAFSSSHLPIPMYDMQKALQEKDNIIEQLNITLKNQEAMIHQRNNADQMTDAPSADCVKLTDLLSKKDQEIEALRNELHGERENKQPDHQLLRCISRQQVSRPEGSHIPVLNRPGTAFLTSHARRKNREAKWKSLHNLTEEFDDEYTPVKLEKSEINQLESCNKLLTEELTQAKSTNENLTRTVEDIKNQIKTLSLNLEEKEDELNSERRNALKRDKTIQGLTQVLKEKEKEIAELCHEIEDRDDALTKAREAAHKAQLQKYQGVEEHQNLLMAKQTELAQLQGEHHAKLLEVQKLQRALDRTEQELTDLQQAKDQLEMDLEDLQQQKKKGDKALNDLNNQLKKLSSEIGERENALEQQYQETLDETKRKLQAHEVTIQRLTSTLADREQQLQEYINMIRDFEQSKSPGGNDTMLSKLRQRLKEKEKALEQALDEKFAAIEEKDNEIHQLQLALREKERDMDRLNNLLSHNEETINSFDSLIKEKDVELQHLANTLKNLQRAKQDVEDNLNRSLREKDAIISQLQLSLEGKTKDMEEITKSMLSQSQTHVNDLAEQMGQRLKVTEAMLAEAVKARERLIADNEGAVEGLLATISSKDQLLKESAEHYNRMLSERSQEIQELKKQLSDRQQQLYATETQSSTAAQESYLETAELKALLAEKDSLINKLLHRGQERDQFLAEMRQKGESDHVLELRQTIQIMQEKLDEREAELSRRNSEGSVENIPITKKTVILKKELAQKTEALNKALKRENELKISLAELQSLLSELEGRNEGHAANIESLTSTLKTKDEIINSLHQRLGQRGDGPADHTQDRVIGPGMERSPPGLPQREKTMIGGDSQQEALPKLLALQQEHDALNKALRAEQQLYSSLVRTVKEQDSAKRLHALQLELTAVQLLRQHLEESVRTNEELREDLEREIHRAKLREGMDLIDPKELESLRHQLEDAQRWNASLQARLGAIQNRGGGVGGANDGGDTLSFIGDQTSYMSICVGEGHDDSLSPQELKDKVLELQDCVSKLQTSNTELQTRLSQMEKSERDACSQEDETKVSSNLCKQQLEEMHPTQPLAQSNKSHHSSEDKETQTDIKAGAKSRLPIPVRLRTEASNDGSTYSVNSDHLQTDTLQPPANIVYGSEHEMHADCDSPTLLQENTSPSPGHRSFSPVGSDKGSDNGNTMDHSHTNSALFTQLELLHQECQEKEALIAKLSEQLADWEELHSQLQIKEQQYVDALQAAESTIAYLTACNLDSQLGSDSGSVDSNAALSSRCLELQKALQEKEELNNQLLELLNMAEQAIFSFNIQEKNPKFSDLCSKIDQGLQHVSSNRDSSKSALGSTGESTQELRQSADTLQDTLLEHNSPNAKLQEKRRATNNNGSQDGKHLQHIAENDDSRAKGSSDNCSINQEMTNVLMNCLNAAESAVASLAAHCSSTGFLPSARSFKFSPDLQMNLDKLQNALQERQEMEESTHPTSKSSSSKSTSSDVSKGQPHQELHQNVCLIYILFNKLSQRISELQASLQEERDRREQTEAPWTVQDGKALPPIVQAQLETLHKALREKKKACKSLEEKLATALTNTSSPETAQKVPALEQDDKGVQVDFQDLGYETSGKSENDREESSSTDLEVGVNPSCSASSLPSLLKQANFSSTENLDSTSSTPYPSSPARSSAKSLKGLQALDEYGVSEDPLQLQAQVRELKVQLENQTKSILQMQSLLQRNSLSSDLAVNDDHSQEKNHRSGQLTEKKEREKQAKTDKASLLSIDLERERPLNRSLSDQLQQTRSRSASPARLDSLVQSQARELSQLRQQIKESRRLGALHRLQLDELGRAFKDLLQASQVDCYMGEVVKEQLDKSLNLLDRLEGRLDKGESHLDNEEVTSLELSHSLQAIQQGSQSLLSYEESIRDPPDSPARIQLELDNLRLELEGERELLQQHVSVLIQHNLTLVECSREQLDLLANELQEKNLLIQRLRSQIKGLSPSSHHSSHSDLDQSDRSSSSCYSATQGRNLPQGQRRLSNWTETPASPVRGAKEEGGSGHRDDASRLQGLQRENGRLYAQLKSSEELNATLRSELDLHHSIMAQNSTHYEEKDQSHDQDKSVPHLEAHKRDISSQNLSTEQPHTVNSDLLAEHLQEIRALRQRLEESIRTNDRLREQLEKKLAEVEKDPATNIFIHGNEEQGQLANEVRFLWEQNQALKEQFNLGSRDKQKENEKLRETLARRTAKLEQSRKDCEDLRQENRQLLERLEHCSQENSQLQDSLHYSKEELHRLQCEVKLQRQQLSDSQHLLQSLRVELQVYEKMKTEVHKHSESTETIKEPFPVSVGSVDLGELLSEIRHLRLQLERSIQTNTALRQKLEEQLLRGASHSETININYLLSSPDEGGRSPGREGCDPLRHSQQCHSEHISIRQDEKRRHHTEVESGSVSSSSSESVSGTPSRLVPGHRMWANRNGRHILGLIEDYNALRKQISEGRKLSRCMDAQLQDCLHTLGLHGSDKVLDLQHLKSLSGNMNTMQQVLEEAGRLLKLVWRVSLPAGTIAGDTSNNEQDELLKSEIARLKSRLSQQERMLSGAVKRLRTTNQLKEGMERVIIDQLCLTHGVLKKARGNLETNYCTFFGLKGLSGGPDEGDPSQWPVEDTTGPQQISAPACLRAGKSSESLEDHNSETSLHCSY
ncbi:CDK5 regulatory subunit-associated protein 2 isoform X10 [Betta splendens]|uniref:CDK5 regulatory subunit-associated protein 2 isoform X10 n=1 Tax=Betta splendens TaxID=158456 RepID=A0A9W2Y681_BETSP|nr:CDK5 regulatory subunit-associated protein 2 isoform X10 [Betta splendens]